MILLIDNYDSFTYNLYQSIAATGATVKVVRNDKITCAEIAALAPDGIILSPGPGRPEQAGICIAVVQQFAESIPLLGVCLGHQAIAAAFGGHIIQSPTIVHGKSSVVFHNRSPLYQAMPLPFSAARYHSLIIDRERLPAELHVEAESSDGIIMGIKHREFPCYGVQFHPESILTAEGNSLLQNFVALTKVTEPC